MRLLLVGLLTLLMTGCASLVTEESLDGIEVIDPERGYLVMRLDSNWRHPNSNPFAGRPMDMSMSTKGQLLKTILFTKPETLKIIPLKPAEYRVTFSHDDMNHFFFEDVTVTIHAGEITNLGTVNVSFTYDSRGRPGWGITSIDQSGFDAVLRDVRSRSTARLDKVTNSRFFPSSRRVSMRNHLRGSYITDFTVGP